MKPRYPSYLALYPSRVGFLAMAFCLLLAFLDFTAGAILAAVALAFISGHRMGFSERPTLGAIKIVGTVNSQDHKYRKPTL